MTDRWRVGERRPPGDFDERDQWRMDGRTVDELGPQDALDGQTVAVGNSDSRTPSFMVGKEKDQHIQSRQGLKMVENRAE